MTLGGKVGISPRRLSSRSKELSGAKSRDAAAGRERLSEAELTRHKWASGYSVVSRLHSIFFLKIKMEKIKQGKLSQEALVKDSMTQIISME